MRTRITRNKRVERRAWSVERNYALRYTLHARRPTIRVSGFSLLEVLVALMILVLGLTTIFGLYGTATYSHRRGINDDIVTRMATAILSELESGQHPASLDLQNRSAEQYSGFPSIYTYDLTFETVTGMSLPTGRMVTLTIKWPKGAKTIGSEIFKTYLIFNTQP